MIYVAIIDNENAIAHCLDASFNQVNLYDDEVLALNAIASSCPQVILINVNINRQHIQFYISQLFKICPHSMIALIGPEFSDDDLLDCLASGSKGYLRYDEVQANINKAVKVLAEGEAWISRRMVAKLLDRIQHQATR